ncbi:hypothetical protein ACO0LL_06620 [Undibacterium sp. TC4M20W]|uniref:hypothetical protein n=1 Tax=Undibacterium sp. TC4M20W TaxID=3413052 RepID=UPI003BF3655A
MTLPSSMQTLALAMLASVFAWSAADKLLHWQDGLAEVRAQLPFAPVILLYGTVFLQTAGSLCLLAAAFFPEQPLLRYLGGWSALALAGFTCMATLLFHAFWREKNARDMRRMLTVFLEHLALAGGLFLAATLLLSS